MATSKAQPFTDAQLDRIARDACDATLALASSYIHTQTESWNTSIINKILSGLLQAAPATADANAPTPSHRAQYKYAVNSTIIQHLTEPPAASAVKTTSTATAGTSTEAGTDGAQQTASPPATPVITPANGAAASEPERGRRGMHSATGAYWNNDTDGMWSFKWEGGESKGMDVVVSVIWVSVS